MSRQTKKNMKKKYIISKKQFKGGRMTTTADTDPYSYRDEEYKEINELLLKGGLNETPSSQGTMSLSELNVENTFNETPEEISGFAQDPDANLNDTLQQFYQDQQNNINTEWYDEGDTDLESFLTQQSSQQSSFPNFSQSTINSDISEMSNGGKKNKKINKKRTIKKKKLIKRKYSRRHKKNK
jgi:hypothetical protein